MKKLLTLITCFTIMFNACKEKSTEREHLLNYPETIKKPIVDTYFKTEITDNYRWLEDDRSKETEKWVGAENKVTFDYLSSHPLRTTFENNGEIINYVPIKESWNVGEGDTFLSALKTTMFDPVEELELYSFFATTNGCAVQPGDKVTVIWEIIYN